MNTCTKYYFLSRTIALEKIRKFKIFSSMCVVHHEEFNSMHEIKLINIMYVNYSVKRFAYICRCTWRAYEWTNWTWQISLTTLKHLISWEGDFNALTKRGLQRADEDPMLSYAHHLTTWGWSRSLWRTCVRGSSSGSRGFCHHCGLILVVLAVLSHRCCSQTRPEYSRVYFAKLIIDKFQEAVCVRGCE